jgi:hypothetical protein
MIKVVQWIQAHDDITEEGHHSNLHNIFSKIAIDGNQTRVHRGRSRAFYHSANYTTIVIGKQNGKLIFLIFDCPPCQRKIVDCQPERGKSIKSNPIVN